VSIVENLLANIAEQKRAARTAAVPVVEPPRLAVAEPEPPAPPAKTIEIDLQRLRAEGYAPEQGEERRFADFCREIKRPLLRKALAAEAPAERRLVMVSSALPGEGKTFVTLNLAFSLARERDLSVLLVDADLPKGHISRALGLEHEPGLLDALADDRRNVESSVVGTDIPGLTVLPAGRPNDGAAELITSSRMAQIAASLVARQPRRLVLFDSPPLLVSIEARGLIQIPGLVLLVARAGHTPRQALVNALAHVEKAKLHGVVVNESRVATEGDPYGYYSYGGERQSRADPPHGG
jgi:protein-tyrosine kinase